MMQLVFASALFAGLMSPSLNRGTEPRPKAIPLMHVSAVDVAEKLKPILGTKARVTFDADSNTVFIRADAEAIQMAKILIRQIEDRAEPLPGVLLVRLHHLTTAEANGALRVIWAVQSPFGDDRTADVVTQERRNAVVLAGNKQKATAAAVLLQWLDAKWKW